MSIFEMVFNLVGLVLGFALVEVLGGLSKAMRLRGIMHVGWLTPLLGLWVLCDVASFWGIAWNYRDLMTSVWPSLGIGLAITSAYYLAASRVFPENVAEHPDLDAHYWQVKRTVAGFVLACNVTAITVEFALGHRWPLATVAGFAVFFSAIVALILLPGKRTNIAILLALLAIDLSFFFQTG